MNLLASRVNTKRAEPKTTSMRLVKDIEEGGGGVEFQVPTRRPSSLTDKSAGKAKGSARLRLLTHSSVNMAPGVSGKL